MARCRKNYIDLIVLITAIITVFAIVIKFIIKVHKFGKWKEFLLSTSILGLIGAFAYCLNEITKVESFFIILGIAFVCYCIYWNKNLGYADNRLNASLWHERQWWWTLDGWQFEQEVAKVFRLHGYKANVTKGSGDGGVDIILKKDGKTLIVQCKHYQNPLGPEAVRALWGCKDDFKANKVIMVASSGLTQASNEFVNNKSEYLVLNLDDIIRMANLASMQDIK